MLSFKAVYLIIFFILLSYQSSSLSISSIQSSIFNIINRNQQGLLSKLIPKSIKQIIGHKPSYIYLSIKKIISNFYSIEYDEDYSVKDEKFLCLLKKASKYCSRIYDHHQLFLKPYSFNDKDQLTNNNLNKTVILSVDKYNYTDCMVVFQASQQQSDLDNSSSTTSSNGGVDVDIWVVIRGTSTKLDFLLDLSWLLTTKSIGHSLGGAMATALYLYYQSTLESLQMPGEVFTFGSPSVLASLPSSQWSYQQRAADPLPIVRNLPTVYRIANYLSQQAAAVAATSSNNMNIKLRNSNKNLNSLSSVIDNLDDNNNHHHHIVTMDSMTLASRIHNIVNELDPIPRLLGSYPLPAYLPLSNNYLSSNSNGDIDTNSSNNNSNDNTMETSSNMITKSIMNSNRNIISMISQSFHGRIRQIRKYYQPFGKYYLLVPDKITTIDISNNVSNDNNNNKISKKGTMSSSNSIPSKYILWEDRNILSSELSQPILTSILTSSTKLNKINATNSNKFNNNTPIFNNMNISSITNTTTNNTTTTVRTILDFFPIDMPGFVNSIVTQHDIKSIVHRLQSL